MSRQRSEVERAFVALTHSLVLRFKLAQHIHKAMVHPSALKEPSALSMRRVGRLKPRSDEAALWDGVRYAFQDTALTRNWDWLMDWNRKG